jgi:hypothetical protein
MDENENGKTMGKDEEMEKRGKRGKGKRERERVAVFKE